MNYNNITKENFKEYENHLFNFIDETESRYKNLYNENKGKKVQKYFVDSEGNDFYKKSINAINIGFSKLFKFSHNNDIYFTYCSSIVYQNTFNWRFNIYQNEFIDVTQIEFIESEYEDIINSHFINDNRVKWGLKELELLKNSETKKRKFLENLLLENNCTVKTYFNAHQIRGKRDIIVEITEYRKQTPIITKPKTNKSLMFEGTNLNIKDRYRILNKVLDFDKKVHPLNIGELEKYQLLAYILGIDKDNARKLMCGSHDAKDNDLTPYFNDLGLNK